MTSQRESKLSRTIQNTLRTRGAFCFKVWGSEHMMAGLPDIIGCYNGRFFAFEVKMADKRDNVSMRQRYVMGLITKAGGLAEVVCSPREAEEFLEVHFGR